MSVENNKQRFFKLRTLFGIILLIVLVLPLSGGYFFRIYESELIRQTEAELISQGIFAALTYKATLTQLGAPADYGLPIDTSNEHRDSKYTPIAPSINVREAPLLPRRPDGMPAAKPPSPFEIKAGQAITPLLEEAKRSTLSGIRVLSPDGTVIGGTGDLYLSFAHTEEVKAALQGRHASVLRLRVSKHPNPQLSSISRAGNSRIFMAQPVISNDRLVGVIYLSRSPRNILKAFYDEREAVLTGGAFIIFLTGMIALLLSHTIGRPLKLLNQQALKLTEGEESNTKLPVPYIEELATLTHSFEKMSYAIKYRSGYIRSFAMHLAHEFKTPLSAIQGALELIVDHPNDMSAEQKNRFLNNIRKDTDRLKALVSRLLELAKADMMQPNNEQTDIVSALELLRTRFLPHVETTYGQESYIAHIGRDIFETVFTNLIENSLQIGATKISIALSADGNKLILDVKDNGSGISDGNLSKIFTPFFTTRRETGGTGLGLVISQSLLKAHGGDVQVISHSGGAHFQVSLNRAS